MQSICGYVEDMLLKPYHAQFGSWVRSLYLSVIAVLTSAQTDCTKGKENQISVSTDSTVQV